MDESDLEMIACNVNVQLRIVDKTKFGIDASQVSSVRAYFTNKGYSVEIMSESNATKVVESGVNQFSYYAIISRK